MLKDKRQRIMLIPSGMPVLMYIASDEIELLKIGTMTYLNSNNTFGAGGHDLDEFDNSFLKSGFLFAADNVKIAQKSTPGKFGCIEGELGAPIGTITAGSEAGFFGNINDITQYDCEPIPMGFWFDIVPGAAQIISSVTGKPEYYDIEIIKPESSIEFVIRMTDKKLLALTDGFLEGMSGSPIIQNGKLIGALRMAIHQDPRIGIAIYINEMFMSHLGTINNILRKNRKENKKE